MSNEAQILLKEIQYKTGLSLEEIAEKIGYSRPYLNNVKLKGGGEKIIGILKEKFAGILQNVPSGKAPESSHPIVPEAPAVPLLPDMTMQALVNMTESHRLMAEGFKMTAEAQKLEADNKLILARAHEELVAMLKQRNEIIVNAELERFEDQTVGTVQAIRELLIDVAGRVLEKPKSQVEKEFRNNVKQAIDRLKHRGTPAATGSSDKA